MASSIRDILVYLCRNYPYPEDLSRARLTKLVYLADWRSAIKRGKQLTDITWVYNHYGPFVDDVSDLADTSSDFTVETTRNAFGSEKRLIRLANPDARVDLDESARAVLDHVIATTSNLNFGEFLNLVYSTYPVRVSSRYDELELPQLAQAYSSGNNPTGGEAAMVRR